MAVKTRAKSKKRMAINAELMTKIEPLTPITTTAEEHDESSDGTSPDIYTSTT